MLNWPNFLTILRIILACGCIIGTVYATKNSLVWALILFILASLTDFFDGYLARKTNAISDFGKLFDPIADKILILGVFVAFLNLKIITVWMVVAIMLREFIITGMRLLALSRGVVLAAKGAGKHKTVSQIVGIIIIYIGLIIKSFFPHADKLVFIFMNKIIPFLMIYIVVVTLGSGIYYFWINRNLIRLESK